VRVAETYPRCRKIERTFARYSALNDTLAVIACATPGCGCGDPKCRTVVNAVLAALRRHVTQRASPEGAFACPSLVSATRDPAALLGVLNPWIDRLTIRPLMNR
jgi:hypothetical protein